MIKRNENIVARKIHDTFFLVDIKQNYINDKCMLFEINEMGYFIWSMLAFTENIETLVDIIIKKIDEPIEKSIIFNDVKTFLNTLIMEGYVINDGRDK